ncbi:MAG: DUF4116 domain-containing protein [Candidatus Saganbacteria bacterium]|nr:DUF4116 domain-containing protein [Candidatus Saganbacteria bacterium]
MPIKISSAPDDYRPYLQEADKKGNNNGEIDSPDEASRAIKEYGEGRSFDKFEEFLSFLEKSGYSQNQFNKTKPEDFITLLNDDSKFVREKACKIIYELISGKKQDVSDAVIKLLVKNLNICRYSFGGWGRFNAFDNYAAKALAELGEKALPYIKEALSDPDENTRKGAVDVLYSISSKKPDIIGDDLLPLIAKNLDLHFKYDYDIYSLPAQTLANIGKRAVPFIAISLSDKNDAVRRWAAHSISLLPKELLTPEFVNDGILRSLSKNLGNFDRETNSERENHPAGALIKIGERALPFIKEALADKDIEVRRGAARVFYNLVEKKPELITDEYLELMYQNINMCTYEWEGWARFEAIPNFAAKTLVLAGKKGTDYLKKALVSEDQNARKGACDGFSSIAPEKITDDLIPLLVSNLNLHYICDYREWNEAADTLKRIGARALPALKTAALSGDPAIQAKASTLYMAMGGKDFDTSATKNKELIVKTVSRDGSVLQQLDASLKKDKEVVLAAVKQSGWALQYADDSLKKDKDVVLAAFNNAKWAIQYADISLKRNKEFMLIITKQEGLLQYADESLKKDKEIVLVSVSKDGESLQYADISLRKDKDVALAAVNQNGRALQYADTSMKTYKDVALAAVNQDGWALEYADISLKKDKEVVLAAFNNAKWAIQYADISLRKNKEFMLIIAKQSGLLEYADEPLKKDKEIVLAAVNQDGKALEYADDPLRMDKEVVLAAVSRDGESLKYADISLKKDKDIVLAAIKQNGESLQYADISLKKDKEIVLAAVRKTGWALKYVDISLKSDKEVVLVAVKNAKWTLQYADKSLQNDPDVLKAAEQ